MSSPMAMPLQNDDKSSTILGVLWGFFPFTLAVITARIWVRIRMHQTGWDDWLMLIAWLCYLASLIPATLVVMHGVGRHAQDLTLDQIAFIAYVVPISQVPSIMCSAFAKASIAFLFQRLLGPGNKTIKYILWISTTIFAVACVVTALLTYLNCSPPSANWDVTNPHAMENCMSPNIPEAINLTQGALGTFQDFLLTAIPIVIVWNLKMNTKRKISLAFLLGLGAFTGAANIVKTAYLPGLTVTTDRTYALSGPYIWVFVETSLNIICGSLPTLKPIYDWLTKRKPLDPKRVGYSSHGSSAHAKWSGHRKSPYTPTTAASESRERALAGSTFTTGTITPDNLHDLQSFHNHTPRTNEFDDLDRQKFYAKYGGITRTDRFEVIRK